MKTAISIPDELFGAAEQAAKRLGLSRSELYRKALRRFLAQHDDRAVTEALNEVYSAEFEPARLGLDPELARLQAASLDREEW